jgi:hypothetical protein
MEKYLLASKESTVVIPKAVASSNKGSSAFHSPSLCIVTQEAPVGGLIPEHAQFKIIVLEEKMADLFLSMLSSGTWTSCSKG